MRRPRSGRRRRGARRRQEFGTVAFSATLNQAREVMKSVNRLRDTFIDDWQDALERGYAGSAREAEILIADIGEIESLVSTFDDYVAQLVFVE